MTTGPEDPQAAARGRFLASDADRERVIDTLKAAFTEGRLTQDELGLRAGQALASRTYGDLAAVVSDLPARPAGARPLPEPARARTRTPEGKALVRGGAGGAIVITAVITAAGATGSDAADNIALIMLWGYILFLLIATVNVINSRLERRLEQRRARIAMPSPAPRVTPLPAPWPRARRPAAGRG